MFVTKEQARQIAREANPSFDAACQRAEQEIQTYLEPVVNYFNRLEEEIKSMKIASRFRVDKAPVHERAMVVSGVLSPSLVGLSEADYKRAQLLSDLTHLRSRAMNLIIGVEYLVMDLQATSTEG